KYGRMGLSFLNAAKVHSGYVGRLALELVNLSNERQPITIKRGDPLMHIEFLKREGEPSPYIGGDIFHLMREGGIRRYVTIPYQVFQNLVFTDQLAQPDQQHGPLAPPYDSALIVPLPA